MATTFAKICSIMKAEDLKFRVHPKKNEALVLLSTKEFKNLNDDKMVPVLVTLLEKGEFLKILAPCVFNLQNCKHSIQKSGQCTDLPAACFSRKMSSLRVGNTA